MCVCVSERERERERPWSTKPVIRVNLFFNLDLYTEKLH